MINYILSKSNIMINYVGFTIVWFSCVYSGAKGDPIIALIPTFIFLFLHLLIVADHLKEEIQLIVISIIFGLIVDSSFSILGFVKYNGTLDFAPNLAPLWIVCMWAGFTAQINHAMKFLIGRYPLICFYGLLAPLAAMDITSQIAEGDSPMDIATDPLNYLYPAFADQTPKLTRGLNPLFRKAANLCLGKAGL